jgi:hypothetical protein
VLPRQPTDAEGVTMPTADETCPVPAAVLNRICRARGIELTHILLELPPLHRARLAAFCLMRARLRSVGKLIAARCDARHLAAAGAPRLG